MKKILFIDATVRKDSRTKILAEHLLGKLGGEVERVILSDENIAPLDEEMLNKRTQWVQEEDYADPYFRYTKQFAEADCIGSCPPFWDLSFPAILKEYLESICVTGITFRYTGEGVPRGLCKAKTVYYITTAGGPIYNPEYKFWVYKSSCAADVRHSGCNSIQS
ncbi:MAG TPA: ACP phosphodiesterase [Clostridiales bacterium]|nr:ACP phosphodiesterase [Clostridiales bacterium]